ncbi:putative benzoate 4-monooxygenase cytochrome P450 [Xylaria palmicola]|nr:putative benzoate 4-monooxygenase cytochrome P450 [Xylaria palmicola]
MYLASVPMMPCSLPSLIVVISSLILIFQYTRQYFRLSHIPGPLLARISNLPRLYWVYHRNAHNIHISQHRRYGKGQSGTGTGPKWAPLIRYGPNAVSVGSAAAIDTIYRMRGDPLKKSDFYSVIPPMRKGAVLPSIFSTQDENLHRMLKRPIAAVYSMSNLVSFEPLVDRTIEVFRQELDRRFVSSGETCDLGAWLQYFAFDVIGEITFSKRLGFLEEGRDVEGIIASIWHWFEYVAVIGQIPWLDMLWVKNKAVSRLRPAKWSPMVLFANKREEERRALSTGTSEGKPSQVNDRDFLSRFQAAMDKDPSIPRWALPAWTSSNIIAGSDTTAIFLRTMLYQLLMHPSSLIKLRAELDEAVANGNLSETATWKESIALPYLNACFKEAGRIHPPFGLHLERVVPPGGIDVCGETLPGGTVVGMNAWVIHRDPAVFGPDADAWIPERWLEGDESHIKRMEASLLTFGAGHRICLGKHISYLEILKLVPTLLQAYDIELVDGGKSFTVQNRWFVPQFGFRVRLHRREPRSGGLR